MYIYHIENRDYVVCVDKKNYSVYNRKKLVHKKNYLKMTKHVKKVKEVVTKVLPQSPPATTNQGNYQTKTCYSDTELEEFRQIILLKIKKIDKDQKNLKQQIKESTNLESRDSTEIFSDGARAHEIRICIIMASQKTSLLDKLYSALARVGNKTYGVCQKTGRLISKERLRSVPHATLCIEAKK